MKETFIMEKDMALEFNFSPSRLKGLCTAENGKGVLLELMVGKMIADTALGLLNGRMVLFFKANGKWGIVNMLL